MSMSKIYKAALIQTSKIISVRQERKHGGDDFIGSSAELDTSHLVAKNSISIVLSYRHFNILKVFPYLLLLTCLSNFPYKSA